MFEWDPAKAASNRVKHGVPFEEAASVFGDPNGLDGADALHSDEEPRRLRLAVSSAGRLLVVAYTMRRRGHEEATRIISSRVASRKERRRYETPDD